jgi:hypothetical protein
VWAGLLTLSLVVSSLALTLDAQANSIDLVVSSSANRANPETLTGATLSGNAYIFTTPDTPDIKRVRFWVDDPAMTGRPYGVDNKAPYDLAGGTVTTAKPFDTTTLADGTHSVTAAIERSTGTDVVTATFTINNGTTTTTSTTSTSTSSSTTTSTTTTSTTSTTVPSGSDHDLVVSSSANRANPETLTGATLSGNAYIFTTPDTADIIRVRFWIDNPAMTGTPYRTENNAPYDLAGGTVTTANPFDTNTLSDGSHSVTAAIERSTGTDVITATFTVNNGTPAPEPGPDQIHLSWNGDPTTSFTVVWRTGVAVGSQVQYRALGTSTWTTAAGDVHTTGLTGVFHRVDVNGLNPGTVYEYRVAADDGGWSDIQSTRTVGADGTFRAIYVADTGIAGRTDGLTTGTEAVVSVIKDRDPHLILGGGDYAYFNTETRFPNLDSAIDAWFRQVEPLTSRSSFMTTYGNHEVLLGEGFGPWANRFATPTGVAGPSSVDTRGNYSFDVGPAHFLSITAVHDSQGVSQAQLDWIQQDIAAAKAAGAQWIIPFFHATPYSDGSNHGSNNALRNQFGPLFEAAGVDLAVYSHDQSFERTYPLINASSTVSSATNQPTSTSLTCYEAPNEGVVWLKTSPGGKLSNKNGDFSQWLSSTPPAWTAVRDNTRHHVTELEVSSEKVVVTTYGIDDIGGRTVQDQFEFTTATCDGSPPTTTTTTSTTTTTTSSTTTSTTTTTVPSGSEHDLVVSSSANRANPETLTGATLSGNAYIFTTPDTADIQRVRFWIDNPAMTGTPYRTENSAPYDLAGGSVSTANPFDTNTLSDGSHSVTAAIERTTGTDVITANFTVSNKPPAEECQVTPPSDPSITQAPFSNVFDGTGGGLCDKGTVGTGFTWVDLPSNGTGYIRSNLEVTGGELRVTTTSGLFESSDNSQDNALAIGLEPQTNWRVSTSLVNPPTPDPGAFQQAGLWFGNDEDNHVKLVVMATPSNGVRVQLRSEMNGAQGSVRTVDVPNLSSSRVDLELSADSINLEVSARFRIDGGTWQSMGTPFFIPVEFFTVDQAGAITKSFAGIMTSHRNGTTPLVYRFDSFGVETFDSGGGGGGGGGGTGTFAFTAIPTTISYKPTGMEWGPDNRLYVLGADGGIRRYLVNTNGTLTLEDSDMVLPTPPSGQTYAALGMVIDPDSTASNITVWVTSSLQGGTNFMEGVANSSTVWRIQNIKNDWTRTAMITGLPRAFENHAINNLHFHPSTGELYIAMGGNTGAGEANSEVGSAFGTRPEQPLSAAWLKANVKKSPAWSPTNDGNCATSVSDGPPPSVSKDIPTTCSVQIVASGLRNMFDFVFHSSGKVYGIDNGLGVNGTVPETYQPDCRGYIDPYIPTGQPGSHDPGPQADPLHELIPGRYYGHPNPSRDECVFFNGTFQSQLHNTTVAPLPNYTPTLKNLNVVGQQGPRSLNTIIEYQSTHFGGAFNGHLVTTAFAGGGAGSADGWQGLYRIDPNNLGSCTSTQTGGNPCAQKVSATTTAGTGYGWNQPLPLQQITDGRLAAGEFVGRTTAGGRLVILIPK